MTVENFVIKDKDAKTAMTKLNEEVFGFFAYRTEKNTISVSHSLFFDSSTNVYMASALICYDDTENSNRIR